MQLMEKDLLNEVAKYDARLAAMLANRNNGQVPLFKHLQHFHELEGANSSSHEKLAEGYVLKILDSTEDPKILSRLRDTTLLHGLGLFRNRQMGGA